MATGISQMRYNESEFQYMLQNLPQFLEKNKIVFSMFKIVREFFCS